MKNFIKVIGFMIFGVVAYCNAAVIENMFYAYKCSPNSEMSASEVIQVKEVCLGKIYQDGQWVSGMSLKMTDGGEARDYVASGEWKALPGYMYNTLSAFEVQFFGKDFDHSFRAKITTDVTIKGYYPANVVSVESIDFTNPQFKASDFKSVAHILVK